MGLHSALGFALADSGCALVGRATLAQAGGIAAGRSVGSASGFVLAETRAATAATWWAVQQALAVAAVAAGIGGKCKGQYRQHAGIIDDDNATRINHERGECMT